jgi:hypothetical protein
MMGTGEGPPKAYTWAPTSPLGGRHNSTGAPQMHASSNPSGQGGPKNPYGGPPPLHSYSSVLASPSPSPSNPYTNLSSSHGSYAAPNSHQMGPISTLHSAGLDIHSNPQGFYTSPSMQTSPGAGGRALHRYTAGPAHAFGSGPFSTGGHASARNHQMNYMAMNGQEREEPQRPRQLNRSLVGEMNQVSTLLQHHGEPPPL